MNINQVFLGGYIGNIEMKALPSGKSVTSFSIATTKRWTKDGQKQEKTEWHNVVFFGKPAEVINQYFSKGSRIHVSGEITYRSWEKDGVKQYRTEIIGNTFEFIDKKSESNNTPSNASGSVLPDYPMEEINPEDIPFN